MQHKNILDLCPCVLHLCFHIVLWVLVLMSPYLLLLTFGLRIMMLGLFISIQVPITDTWHSQWVWDTSTLANNRYLILPPFNNKCNTYRFVMFQNKCNITVFGIEFSIYLSSSHGYLFLFLSISIFITWVLFLFPSISLLTLVLVPPLPRVALIL